MQRGGRPILYKVCLRKCDYTLSIKLKTLIYDVNILCTLHATEHDKWSIKLLT